MTPAPVRRIPVAVLGATGLVGHTIVRRLVRHPWFELRTITGDTGVGRRYGAVMRDRGLDRTPFSRLAIQSLTPEAVDAQVVLSALPAAAARSIEPALARRGCLVVTNASAFRLDPHVPLVIPEVNAGDLDLLAEQRVCRQWPGGLVTNPNCSTVLLTLALAPLHWAFGLDRVVVTTLQAVSGAGRSGLPALDLTANVVPYIEGEEEKIGAELPRLLSLDSGSSVVATAIRVPVTHGHLASVVASFDERITERAAARVWRGFRDSAVGGLPSAPSRPLRVLGVRDRPQPRMDAGTGRGMVVTIGRVRATGPRELSFVACGHNLIRGAAGAALLNAELLVQRGWLD